MLVRLRFAGEQDDETDENGNELNPSAVIEELFSETLPGEEGTEPESAGQEGGHVLLQCRLQHLLGVSNTVQDLDRHRRLL